MDALDPVQIGGAAAAGLAISIAVIRTTLNYLKEKVDSIDSKLDTMTTKFDEKLDNHEARLIKMEVPRAPYISESS